MGRKQRRGKGEPGLANLSHLRSHDPDDRRLLQVIIETPKGSRNKYAFDANQKVFRLKRVLPAGMAFPDDFGLVPSTRADDGDPLDVLVLMDEAAFPGCLLTCRPIGVIEGEQIAQGKKKAVRNDRLVAIEQANHTFANVKHIRDLGARFRKELEEFFVNYHDLQDEAFRILGLKGPGTIRKLLKRARS